MDIESREEFIRLVERNALIYFGEYVEKNELLSVVEMVIDKCHRHYQYVMDHIRRHLREECGKRNIPFTVIYRRYKDE